ncbi:MAG: hypothetical protein K2O14_06085 [Oscillospiraceae bacterium]|nr:hypothetical protein [Oscillospiraceae bacterium]
MAQEVGKPANNSQEAVSDADKSNSLVFNDIKNDISGSMESVTNINERVEGLVSKAESLLN